MTTPNQVDSYASRFHSDTVTYRITFEDFSVRSATSYSTNTFQPDIPCKPVFRFTMLPRFAHNDRRYLNQILNPTYYVPLRFDLIDSDETFYLASTVSILGANDEKLFTSAHRVYHNFDYDGSRISKTYLIMPRLVQIDNVIEKTEGKLIYFVELTFQTQIIEHSEPSHSLIPMVEAEQAQLNNSLTNMLLTAIHADVIFIIEQNTHLFAHKCILTSRSPVFAAMFEHETIEARRSKVIIPDIEVNTFWSMLYFIYSSRMPEKPSLDEICNLLAVASKYQIESLKNHCECALVAAISPVNVQALLVLGDLHSAQILKSSALNYLKCNLESVIDAMYNSQSTDEILQTFQDVHKDWKCSSKQEEEKSAEENMETEAEAQIETETVTEIETVIEE